MSPAAKKAADARARSADEAKIRERLEAWARAVREHDLDVVVAHHAADLVYFDVPPPARVRGLSGYRSSWPPFFQYLGATGRFDLDELRIVAGAEVAFAHALLRVQGEGETSPATVRLTVGLRKIDDEWIVVHEHHSAPYEA